jgi:hypothetical protein
MEAEATVGFFLGRIRKFAGSKCVLVIQITQIFVGVPQSRDANIGKRERLPYTGRARFYCFSPSARYNYFMQGEVVEIPKQVLASVETLDELYDWLTMQHAGIMAELREARQEDLDGKFKAWKPRWSTESK